jgi:hypothetical protein
MGRVRGLVVAGLLGAGGVVLADDGVVVSSSPSAVVVEREPRVSVDSLFAPIGSLQLRAPVAPGAAPESAVQAPVLDELISQQLASDKAGDYFGEQRTVPGGLRGRPLSSGRKAYAFRHQPLYFAQPALEVSGESMVGLNPFIAAGWFAVDAALLPARLVCQPPCSRVSSGR